MSQSPWELPPDERITESFKSPYDPDGEYLSAVISAVANEMAEFEAALAEVNKAKFVDTAQGQQLDKLASLVQLERRTGESDATFRLRIKVEFLVQFASGTSPDLLSIISTLLDADPRLVEILEPVDDGGPSVAIVIPVDRFGRIKVAGDVFEESLQRVTAAGVELETRVNIGEADFGVDIFPAQSESLGVNRDFIGFDIFDGTGTFGALGDTDTTGSTQVAYDQGIEIAQPDTQTEQDGFGVNPFGSGILDGETDPREQFGGVTDISYQLGISITNAVSLTSNGLGAGDSFDGAGSFSGGLSNDVRGSTNLRILLNLLFDDATSTSFGGFGSSGFNAGSFDGTEDDTDIFGTTALSTLLTATFTSATATEINGTFGEGVFGAGALDGTLDDQDVFGITTATPFDTIIDYADANGATVSKGVGEDAFDGAGAFSAGIDSVVRSKTTVATVLNLVFGTPTTTDVAGIGGGVFGGGSFDGTEDADTPRGLTSIETVFDLLFNPTTSGTTVRGFDAQPLDGTGAFGADGDGSVFDITDETSLNTVINYANANRTKLSKNISGDSFDGAGAFGAGIDDTVRGTTTFPINLNLIFGPPTTVEIGGMGESAFGAGSFDGTEDTTTVRGVTNVESIFNVSFGDTKSSVEIGGFGDKPLDGTSAFGVDEDGAVFEITNSGLFTVGVDYANANGAKLSEGVGGSDAFDGTGAFTAGTDDIVRTSTAISSILKLVFGTPTTVEIGGMGSSAFGAGSFDGSEDTPTVRGVTNIESIFNVSFTTAKSSAEIGGFGDGPLDGTSAFGADGDGGVSNTSLSTTILTVVWSSSTSHTDVSDGFGANSFDGSGTFS